MVLMSEESLMRVSHRPGGAVPARRQFFQETDTYRFVGGARGGMGLGVVFLHGPQHIGGQHAGDQTTQYNTTNPTQAWFGCNRLHHNLGRRLGLFLQNGRGKHRFLNFDGMVLDRRK